jgi:hypothetical protein
MLIQFWCSRLKDSSTFCARALLFPFHQPRNYRRTTVSSRLSIKKLCIIILLFLRLYRFQEIPDRYGTVYVYGDPEYTVYNVLQVPFKGASLSEENEFHQWTRNARVSVEWCFGNVISLFPFVDFKKNLKLYLQPVWKLYPVGLLLVNIHTCFFGSSC